MRDLKREFREDGSYDSAVEVPAGHLVEVTVLLVEEHQDEFLRQTQRMGLHVIGGNDHRFPPLQTALIPPTTLNTLKTTVSTAIKSSIPTGLAGRQASGGNTGVIHRGVPVGPELSMSVLDRLRGVPRTTR